MIAREPLLKRALDILLKEQAMTLSDQGLWADRLKKAPEEVLELFIYAVEKDSSSLSLFTDLLKRKIEAKEGKVETDDVILYERKELKRAIAQDDEQ